MHGIIYKATGPDGRAYIGQTTKRFKKRISEHAYRMKKGDKRTPFHAALLALGFDNFTWEQIDQADTQEELDMKEKHYITHYKANDPSHGYNIFEGGSSPGVPIETRRKISESKKGIKNAPLSEEARRKISEKLKGRKQTPEHIRNNRKAQMGRKLTPEHRRKLSEARKGKKHGPISDKHRRAISEGLKRFFAQKKGNKGAGQ